MWIIAYLDQMRKKGERAQKSHNRADMGVLPRGFECVRLLLHGVPHHLPEALGHGEREVSGRDLRRVDGAALEYLGLGEEGLLVVFDVADGVVGRAPPPRHHCEVSQRLHREL